MLSRKLTHTLYYMLGMKACLHLYLLGNNVINCRNRIYKTSYYFLSIYISDNPNKAKVHKRLWAMYANINGFLITNAREY